MPHLCHPVLCHICATLYCATPVPPCSMPHLCYTVLCYTCATLYCATLVLPCTMPHLCHPVLCHICATLYCATPVPPCTVPHLCHPVLCHRCGCASPRCAWPWRVSRLCSALRLWKCAGRGSVAPVNVNRFYNKHYLVIVLLYLVFKYFIIRLLSKYFITIINILKFSFQIS